MAERLNFTKRAMESILERHDGARIVVHDEKQPGLIAELRAGGTLSFYLYRWADGRPHRIRIGVFPAITVEAARDQAKRWLAKLVDGIDPQELKRERRGEASLKDLFDHWLIHAKAHKKTWQEDQRQFDKLLKGWHTRRLSTLSRGDWQGKHASVGKVHGPYAANRLLALVRAMFNKAADVGYEGLNPTKGIKKFKEQSRDRFLQPDELPAFFAAVKAEPNDILRDFFLVLLYTGARRSNVQSMRWEQVNLDAATWRIPDTKSGEPVTVHLPTPAVVILAARQSAADESCPWVFPGGKKNQAGHLQDPKAAWKRLCTKAGLKDLRLHDLRRTLGSYQAAAGASLAIIGKSLGHKPGSPATAVYARMNLDPVRASVDVATAAILAAASKENGHG